MNYLTEAERKEAKVPAHAQNPRWYEKTGLVEYDAHGEVRIWSPWEQKSYRGYQHWLEVMRAMFPGAEG